MSSTPSDLDPRDTPAEDPACVTARPVRPKRRRLLFLGGALVCLIGAAAYLKWSAVRDARNTQSARAALAAAGISVIETSAEPDDSASPFQSLTPPKVVRIQSSTNQITDDELTEIAGIRQDLNLVLSSCPITNQGLAVLAGKPNVRFLDLAKTAVTDEGLKNLRGMNLQSLNLSSTRVTDAGLATLGDFDFPNLKEITLEHTRVTDAGLMHLMNFKALELVSIVGTKVTKDGIRHLKDKLPEAHFLN
jgi:Leucine Rich repeat